MSPTTLLRASELADKIATEHAIAKDTGAFDTRCFTENVELIIAALRASGAVSRGADLNLIRQDLKTA